MSYRVNKKVIFCFTIILMGFLDLLTTVVGIVFFGATEVNPLFSSLTQASTFFFIGIKTSAVLLSGFLFYKGASITELSAAGPRLETRILEIGYFAALTFLTYVVINNIVTISQLA
jgi:hypothetical protein